MNDTTIGDVLPHDDSNRALVANVHPPDWQNPDPAPMYNLVVIGAGTAGLVSAAGAAGLGARVALVEKHLLGGDCLNVGCVPSKCIIRSSRAVAELLRIDRFGVGTPTAIDPDFSGVMARMRKIRARISQHDSAARFRDLGIDMFLGEGRFTGPGTADVGGRTLRFKKAVIATGARASAPPVEGLMEAGFLTNETIFSLTERPGRLCVLGSGPIGCELAQAFSRLGCEVTIVVRSRFLSREDPDASALLADVFREEGIHIVTGALKRVTAADGKKVVTVESDGSEMTIPADEILVGTGRAPNVEGIGLETVGVEHNAQEGVRVDDRMRTTNPAIYAAGDVCMKHKFTHAADFAARIVIQNALFMGRKKLSALTIPWCTYTDPEIAHVGLYARDAEQRGIPIDTLDVPFSDVDRALADGEDNGFVRIHVRKGSDAIVGATIVASHAGDMISELSVAMAAGMGLGKLAAVIHPYPTQAEAIRKAGDAYNRTRLTPGVKKLFVRWMNWQRRRR